MGLTIHYRGALRKPEFLPALIEEVKDIAKGLKWNYFVFEDKFPENSFSNAVIDDKIYGISLSVTNCEPIWFCFLSNGKMSNHLLLEFFGNSKIKKEQKYLYLISTKTQFAGKEVHKFIVNLFKYLNTKYLKYFKMYDEGQYWESGDENVLAENFRIYESIFENFSKALEDTPLKKGESIENYLENIFLEVHKKIRRKKEK